MLLTAILAVAVVTVFNVEALYDTIWKVIIFWAVWVYTAIQTLKIYGRFLYKVETLHRLVEKGRKKYDFRLFYPYMGTACMRHVVYFSLCELGRQDDYRIIRYNFFAGTPDTQEPSTARVVKPVYEDGVLKFLVKSDSGQWEPLD